MVGYKYYKHAKAKFLKSENKRGVTVVYKIKIIFTLNSCTYQSVSITAHVSWMFLSIYCFLFSHLMGVYLITIILFWSAETK